MKPKRIDSIEPIRVRMKKEKPANGSETESQKEMAGESGCAAGSDLTRYFENALLAKMLRDAVNDLV